MEKKILNPEEITYERVVEYLNEMFFAIREARNTEELTDEGKDLLDDCLDGSPKGVTGVQLLMGNLNGSTYTLVKDPNTGESDYVKDQSADPKVIYEKANQLVDLVNSIIEENKKGKSL